MKTIQKIDFAVLNFIQKHLRCAFLDAVIPMLTDIIIVLWIALALAFTLTRRYRACGLSMCAGMTAGMLIGNLILKNLIQRPRPCWINETVQLLVDIPQDYSFPSAHTLVSFIAATVIFRHSRRLGIPALILAAFTAFTRLYLYVHFPTDILGGAALAAAIAISADILVKKILQRFKN